MRKIFAVVAIAGLFAASAHAGEIEDRLWQLAANASGTSAQGQVQQGVNPAEAVLNKEQIAACQTSCADVLTPCTFSSTSGDNCTSCKHTNTTAAGHNRTREGDAFKPKDGDKKGWYADCDGEGY
ncbi:MAG: hypothetical protein AAGJ28_24605 [Pseudomonadota bacterium]